MNLNAKPLPALVKILDDLFSKFVRSKDADENGITKCYTCDQSNNWKLLHCGHFLSRKHYALRWSENNCRPQCVTCNIELQGNPVEFESRLVNEIGFDTVYKMHELVHITEKLDRQLLIEKIQHIKNLLTKI